MVHVEKLFSKNYELCGNILKKTNNNINVAFDLFIVES